ncbi:Uncharacterised protein [Shigella flexneri]|nr:Uncharacterised protein [Shigella flexneri]
MKPNKEPTPFTACIMAICAIILAISDNREEVKDLKFSLPVVQNVASALPALLNATVNICSAVPAALSASAVKF